MVRRPKTSAVAPIPVPATCQQTRALLRVMTEIGLPELVEGPVACGSQFAILSRPDARA